MSDRDNRDGEPEKKDIVNSVADGRGQSDLHGYSAGIHEEPRRGFMQKLGALAAPIVASVPGLSSRVAARRNGDLGAARAAYESQADVKAAFQKHASDLVAGLAEEGVLESGSVATLLAEAETKVTAVKADGTPSAHIEANRELPTGEILSVFVQPQAGRSYAIQRDNYHDTATIYDASADGDWVVTPQCTAGGACYEDICSSMPDLYSYKETYCCSDGSCYTGSETQCCQDNRVSSCSSVC